MIATASEMVPRTKPMGASAAPESKRANRGGRPPKPKVECLKEEGAA